MFKHNTSPTSHFWLVHLFHVPWSVKRGWWKNNHWQAGLRCVMQNLNWTARQNRAMAGNVELRLVVHHFCFYDRSGFGNVPFILCRFRHCLVLFKQILALSKFKLKDGLSCDLTPCSWWLSIVSRKCMFERMFALLAWKFYLEVEVCTLRDRMSFYPCPISPHGRYN